VSVAEGITYNAARRSGPQNRNEPMTRMHTAAALMALLLATPPALGQGPAAPAAPAPGVDRATRLKQIEVELAEQQKLQDEARSGYVTAAVFVGVGVVVSALRTVENQQEAEDEAIENGESKYEYKVDYAGTLIGALIALPIVLAASRKMDDASARSRELYNERYRLGLAPNADGATLVTLRYEF
jgi:hypothetical protein